MAKCEVCGKKLEKGDYPGRFDMICRQCREDGEESMEIIREEDKLKGKEDDKEMRKHNEI